MTIFGTMLPQEPVLEKYVGSQRKEFKQIEAELKKIIDLVNKKYTTQEERIEKGDKGGVQLTDADLNQSDSTRTIEKLFKKVFNLRDFALDWSVNPISNAMTFIKSFLFTDKNYKTDKTGHQTNKDLFIGMTVMTGLITYSKLNEKELMAIMLHEIGHNFYNSVFNTLATIPLSIPFLTPLLDALNVNERMFKNQKRFKEFMWNKFPKTAKLFTNINDSLFYFGRLSSNPVSRLLNSALNIQHLLNSPMAPVFRYSTEKHADSFAVDYGYGIYLAKALDKMGKSYTAYESQYYETKLGWLYDFIDVQASLLSSIVSGYPTDHNRLRSILDRLEASTHDPNLDPRVRKELENQTKQYKDFYYNEYMKIEKDEVRLRTFSTFFKTMVEEQYDGKFDLREYVDKLDPKRHV